MPHAHTPQSAPYRHKLRGTLCWKCQNASNSGCSWSRNFTPVEGWEATPTISDRATNTSSYHVHSCPRFKAIKSKKKTHNTKKWYEQ